MWQQVSGQEFGCIQSIEIKLYRKCEIFCLFSCCRDYGDNLLMFSGWTGNLVLWTYNLIHLFSIQWRYLLHVVFLQTLALIHNLFSGASQTITDAVHCTPLTKPVGIATGAARSEFREMASLAASKNAMVENVLAVQLDYCCLVAIDGESRSLRSTVSCRRILRFSIGTLRFNQMPSFCRQTHISWFQTQSFLSIPRD